jgi:hypothetical protein
MGSDGRTKKETFLYVIMDKKVLYLIENVLYADGSRERGGRLEQVKA